jgi:hypothetical protein
VAVTLLSANFLFFNRFPIVRDEIRSGCPLTTDYKLFKFDNAFAKAATGCASSAAATARHPI